MPRIPEPKLQRLREEVSVQRVMEAGGVELKKAGKDGLGRRPWHDDAEGSRVVSPAKIQLAAAAFSDAAYNEAGQASICNAAACRVSRGQRLPISAFQATSRLP